MAYENAKNRNDELKIELDEAWFDEKHRVGMDEEDRMNLLFEFAKHLSEPKLDFFLGVVKIDEEPDDIRTLNILREPAELVISIPVDSIITIDEEPIQIGAEYYLFVTAELFCPERDDCTPLDFSPTSTRTAQRDLISLLRRDARNGAFEVSRPVIPSSVALRGTSEETLSDLVKCFDLSELVRDCHYPIQDRPLAETPTRLAESGLVLRNYQRTSLRWLIDKESNPTGIGSSGEIWSRMTGLGGGDDEAYFYCELTGSLVKNIFNYHADVEQKGVFLMLSLLPCFRRERRARSDLPRCCKSLQMPQNLAATRSPQLR